MKSWEARSNSVRPNQARSDFHCIVRPNCRAKAITIRFGATKFRNVKLFAYLQYEPRSAQQVLLNTALRPVKHAMSRRRLSARLRERNPNVKSLQPASAQPPVRWQVLNEASNLVPAAVRCESHPPAAGWLRPSAGRGLNDELSRSSIRFAAFGFSQPEQLPEQGKSRAGKMT